MLRHLRRTLPVLLGAGCVLGYFGRLAEPGGILAVRDLPIFHLPLRTALARLAGAGAPLWNPWIHGGQPILSNPNYAAFYPPTWLVLAFPPHRAIHLLILLHAGLAFTGAWRFGIRLGLGRPARVLAAVAFVGGGAFVSSPNTLNLFCGLSWMPWVLLWGDRALRAETGERWLAPAVLAAGGLALQLLAGEPVMVLVTGLALACLAGDAAVARAGRPWRLAPIAGLSALLAAIQLAPTLGRLTGTSRLAGLAAEQSSTWSTPPARLAEWLFPTLYGDPMLAERNLYFGYGLHDQDYPYVLSIYCGQLVVVLALAGLLRWPIRRRLGWAAMIVVGIGLALGRHNPLYAGLLADLPPFSLLRYPEKFLLLANAGVAFAAAAAWDHLLERRRSGRPETVDQALALALVVAGVSTVFAIVVQARPDAAEWFMRANSPLPRSPEVQAAGLAYLREQSLTALALALAASAVLAAHRLPRLPEKVLVLGLLAVTATDLWLASRTFFPVAPASEMLAPPPVVQELPAGPGRIFSDHGFHQGSTEILLLDPTDPVPSRLRAALDRLDPYTGTLWGLGYALNEDFDLMLTGWARHGLEAFHETLEEHGVASAEALRIMGAWGVGHLLLRRPFTEVTEDWRLGDRRPSRVRIVPNPERQPPLRPLAAVDFHIDPRAALAAARAAGFAPDAAGHWVGEPRRGMSSDRRRPPALSAATIGATRIGVDYDAQAGGFLEVAVTWDAGWSAEVGGEAVRIHPTALGQVGVELPPGRGRVELGYRERGLTPGAGLTLLGLAAAVVLVHRERRSVA